MNLSFLCSNKKKKLEFELLSKNVSHECMMLWMIAWYEIRFQK